jgi:hypothetical protein
MIHGQTFELKNDKYRKARDGVAKFLDISCANCGTWLLLYQKDGIGTVKRLYLNRIFAPASLAALQTNSAITSTKHMKKLTCTNCNAIIGTPMLYDDGRLAYLLRLGSFSKKKNI